MTARQRRRPLLVPPASGDPLSHGLAMVAAPVTFGLVGSLLDGQLGTRPVLLLTFAAFGVAASFASAYYRYSLRMDREREGKPWARKVST